MKYIASCSGGKDSVAMVLKLVEQNYPLDCVVFIDLGMEFQSIYNVWNKLCSFLDTHNIPHKHIKIDFTYYATQKEVIERKDGSHLGYGWCGGICRWGTALKRQELQKFYKSFTDETIVEYVGIASDEKKRITVKRANTVKLYPLVHWGMTENDCLVYCYKHGYDWKENDVSLYDVLDRVSCFCCTNKNQAECKAMIEKLPEYWNRIKDLESRIGKPYKDIGCDNLVIKLKTSEINNIGDY